MNQQLPLFGYPQQYVDTGSRGSQADETSMGINANTELSPLTLGRGQFSGPPLNTATQHRESVYSRHGSPSFLRARKFLCLQALGVRSDGLSRTLIALRARTFPHSHPIRNLIYHVSPWGRYRRPRPNTRHIMTTWSSNTTNRDYIPTPEPNEKESLNSFLPLSHTKTTWGCHRRLFSAP